MRQWRYGGLGEPWRGSGGLQDDTRGADVQGRGWTRLMLTSWSEIYEATVFGRIILHDAAPRRLQFQAGVRTIASDVRRFIVFECAINPFSSRVRERRR